MSDCCHMVLTFFSFLVRSRNLMSCQMWSQSSRLFFSAPSGHFRPRYCPWPTLQTRRCLAATAAPPLPVMQHQRLVHDGRPISATYATLSRSSRSVLAASCHSNAEEMITKQDFISLSTSLSSQPKLKECVRAV